MPARPRTHRGRELVAFLIRQPLWLLGWVAATAGFAFQALALHHGQLAIVQTLLVSELVFALVLRRFWVRQHVAKMAWMAAFVTCAALAVFLAVAEPHGGHRQPDATDWATAVTVFGGAVALLAVLARWGSPTRRAALYAVAASITWALMAAFIKATTDVLAASGLVGMLAHWPIYALIVSAVVGSVLQQAALQVGPLSVSQPLIVVTDPAVAIVLSVWIFNERFTVGTAQRIVAARGLPRHGRRGHGLVPGGASRPRPLEAGAALSLDVPLPRGRAGQTELMGSEGKHRDRAVLVRPARSEDLDELVEHTWAVAAEGRWTGAETPFDREARRARLDALRAGEMSTVLVADTAAADGPGIVGYISIEIAPYGVADIGMLVIAGWRGRGVGAAMLDAAIEWASSAGAHKMALEVWPHNSAAIELYRRAGFVEEGRKLRHYRRRNGEIWDAVLMGRPLSGTSP